MTQQDSPKNAVLQGDKKTFAIIPRVPAGILSAEQIRRPGACPGIDIFSQIEAF